MKERYKVTMTDSSDRERYELLIEDTISGVGDACFISYEVAEDVPTLLMLLTTRFGYAINGLRNEEGKNAYE